MFVATRLRLGGHVWADLQKKPSVAKLRQAVERREGVSVERMAWSRATHRGFAMGVVVWLVVLGGSARAVSVPDGRGFELVTPAQKFGYQIGNNGDPRASVSVSRDGERVSYDGVSPLVGSEASGPVGLLGFRTPEGWATASWIGAPDVGQLGMGLPGYDELLRGETRDQTAAVYYDNTTVPHASLWLSRLDGSRQMIVMAATTVPNQWFGEGQAQPWFEAISDDGRHVVFEDTRSMVNGQLLTDDPGGCCKNLYEWVDDGGDGTLRLVHSAPGVATELAGRHAVSSDGSRIFFQSPSNGGPIYVRVDATDTIDVTAPQNHTPGTVPTTYRYLDAAVDGSRVFFWADGDLTDDADPTGGIYRYDVNTGQLTFLTTAWSSITAMASDDGHYLYFTDGDNLDVTVDGERRTILADFRVMGGTFQQGAPIEDNPGLRDDSLANNCASANISSDGRYLTFSGAFLETLSQQVYRYDATAGQVLHLSTSPTDPGGFEAGFVGAGSCGSLRPRSVRARVMSEDGRYVFFDTYAPLVPQDTNGVADAYEWHDGQVQLISSGTHPKNSLSAGTDATGSNEFFITEESLVPQDGDGVYDIYDARIGGGFPFELPRTCTGESCQPPASRGLNDVKIGSLEAAPGVVSGSALRFFLRRPSRSDRLRLARVGRLPVSVRATGAGVLSTRLRVHVGNRWVQTDTARKALHRRGTARFTLKLTRDAHAALENQGVLRVRLVARYSRSSKAKSVTFSVRSTTSTRNGR